MPDANPQTALPEPAARALARLADAGVHDRLVEHQAAYTAADEATAAGVDLPATVKTLVLIDHHRVRLALIPASHRLDLARARAVLACGRHLRLASEDELGNHFPQFPVGALPPYAAGALPEVIDIRLLYRDSVLCAAGDHRHSLLLDPRELFRLAEPRVADICEHEVPEHRFSDVPHV